ncbi:MAG: prepilin-type N-terminal cleavage/methylation domain-containing protein [Rhodocyclales bacterium]|nr:prepilin-type N-terminal cleavage/methylation domain-containing protein [Rhodocyclales bacterium]
MFRPVRRQAGFTMVEVAAVMVIGGLIYGSVMKNQELVASATAKRLANDFSTVTTAVRTYEGLYRSLPGDDRAAADHVGGALLATTPAGSIGNARIDGAWNSLTETDESYLAWQHLRLARIVGGTTEVPSAPAAGDAYNPRNGAEGRIGVTSAPVLTSGVWPAALFACASGIDGRLARRVDRMLDDGSTASGDVRVICEGECSSGAGISLTPANEAGTYTLCSAI